MTTLYYFAGLYGYLVAAVTPGANNNILTSNGTSWVSATSTAASTGKAIAMSIVFGG
jgi:threonine/homoserine/homoserine lactone efflux protein